MRNLTKIKSDFKLQHSFGEICKEKWREEEENNAACLKVEHFRCLEMWNFLTFSFQILVSSVILVFLWFWPTNSVQFSKIGTSKVNCQSQWNLSPGSFTQDHAKWLLDWHLINKHHLEMPDTAAVNFFYEPRSHEMRGSQTTHRSRRTSRSATRKRKSQNNSSSSSQKTHYRAATLASSSIVSEFGPEFDLSRNSERSDGNHFCKNPYNESSR